MFASYIFPPSLIRLTPVTILQNPQKALRHPLSLNRLAYLSILYLLSSILSPSIFATDLYWVGPDNGLWSDPNNWSLIPNGPGGAGVPTGGPFIAGDHAFVGVSANQSLTFDGDYPPPNAGFGVLFLSASSNNSLTFLQSSGTLNSASESVGTGALYSQSGGRNAMTSGFTVSGTYSLSGTGSLFEGGGVNISIRGSMIQTGGSAIGNNGVVLSSGGRYSLTAGSLGCDYLEIADGSFTQGGGSVTSGQLFMSRSVSNHSTYNFSGGTISIPVEYIGEVGYASLNQTGGTNTFNTLHINANASYTLGAGVLQSTPGPTFQIETLSGTMTQTGGTNLPNNLSIGGTYRLDGGSLTASVLDNGGQFQLKPAASTSLASYTQSSTGNLDLELDGTTPDLYAHLSPTSSASLAGLLTIDLASNFSHELGDTFLLLDTPSLTGAFSSYNLPPLSPGLQWQPAYTPSSFSLTVVVPEPSAFLLLPSLLLLRRRRLQN